MKVKIPREFKFMSHPIKIVFDDKECAAQGASGLARYYEQQIAINTVSALSERDQIFWHEALHHICRHMSVMLEDNDNDRIAEGLVHFLKDCLGLEFDWSNIKEG